MFRCSCCFLQIRHKSGCREEASPPLEPRANPRPVLFYARRLSATWQTKSHMRDAIFLGRLLSESWTPSLTDGFPKHEANSTAHGNVDFSCNLQIPGEGIRCSARSWALFSRLGSANFRQSQLRYRKHTWVSGLGYHILRTGGLPKCTALNMLIDLRSQR